MEINKLLTPYNYSNGELSRIKYIVIHYVGALGGAEANCKYYASQYVGASAHYFVGFSEKSGSPLKTKTSHGTAEPKPISIRNAATATALVSSCVSETKAASPTQAETGTFEDATVASAKKLTKQLMEQYGVKEDHVIRHYDVTGKICPILTYTTTPFTPGKILKILFYPSRGKIRLGGRGKRLEILFRKYRRLCEK